MNKKIVFILSIIVVSFWTSSYVLADSEGSLYYLYLSNSTYIGNLGGRSGADTKCNTDANKPEVCTSNGWAFIVVSADDEIRDMPTTKGVDTAMKWYWYRAGSACPAASNWTDLLDGTILQPASNCGFSGSYWTGSSQVGGVYGARSHCVGAAYVGTDSWGMVGDSTASDQHWWWGSMPYCDAYFSGPRPILCACEGGVPPPGLVDPAVGTVNPVTGAAQTTYTAPLIDVDTTYTCTLNIADNKGSSDYDSVNISVKTNQPPAANICCQLCSSPNCTTYTGQIFTLVNDSHDPDLDTDIIKSEWDILGWGSNPDLSCPNTCNYTPQTLILGPGNYTAELYIEDSYPHVDTDTQTFAVKQSAIADFKCSLIDLPAGSPNWKNCSDIKLNVDEVVYFLDQSSPPQDGSITSYSWIFQNGNPATATGTNPSTKFQSAGLKQATLTLGVTAGAPASETKTISIQLPLPEWEEVAPF